MPALELERAVLAAARLILADQAALVASINNAPESAGDVERMLAAAANWREQLGRKDEARGALAELIQRVQLAEAGLRVTLNVPAASTGAGQGGGISLSHFVPMTMKRRGVELRLILDGHGEKRRQLDPALLKALGRARCWFEELACGRVGSLAAIARREGLRKRYVTCLTKLAFVAPEITEAIATGRAPSGVNLQMLMDGRVGLAPCWSEQQPIFSGVHSIP